MLKQSVFHSKPQRCPYPFNNAPVEQKGQLKTSIWNQHMLPRRQETLLAGYRQCGAPQLVAQWRSERPVRKPCWFWLTELNTALKETMAFPACAFQWEKWSVTGTSWYCNYSHILHREVATSLAKTARKTLMTNDRVPLEAPILKSDIENVALQWM